MDTIENKNNGIGRVPGVTTTVYSIALQLTVLKIIFHYFQILRTDK